MHHQNNGLDPSVTNIHIDLLSMRNICCLWVGEFGQPLNHVRSRLLIQFVNWNELCGLMSLSLANLILQCNDTLIFYLFQIDTAFKMQKKDTMDILITEQKIESCSFSYLLAVACYSTQDFTYHINRVNRDDWGDLQILSTTDKHLIL